MLGRWIATLGVGASLVGAATLRAQIEPRQGQLAAAVGTVVIETAEHTTVGEISFAGLRRISSRGAARIVTTRE